MKEAASKVNFFSRGIEVGVEIAMGISLSWLVFVYGCILRAKLSLSQARPPS